MERKRKVVEENESLVNEKRYLHEELIQKSAAYEQLREKVKETENEITSIKNRNKQFTDKLNKEISTLKER